MVSEQAKQDELQFFQVGEGEEARQIAVRFNSSSSAASSSRKPGLVWLGGYRSDMLGTKAEAFHDHAAGNNMDFLRFDYSGHGESGGEFREGTISRWLEESLAVFDHFTDGTQILVGSSMGGWIALRMAQELKKCGEAERIHAMLLLAPGQDFNHELMLPRLGEKEKQDLETRGYFEEFSEYSDEPNIFTRALIEDGESNAIMRGPVELDCPVQILQGMEDPDVPWQHAMKLAEHMANVNLTMTVIRDGDHRLSRVEDIEKMLNIVDNLTT